VNNAGVQMHKHGEQKHFQVYGGGSLYNNGLYGGPFERLGSPSPVNNPSVVFSQNPLLYF